MHKLFPDFPPEEEKDWIAQQDGLNDGLFYAWQSNVFSVYLEGFLGADVMESALIDNFLPTMCENNRITF